MSDWITRYLELTEALRAPYSFRLWSAIGTISAVLERRVWTVTDAPQPLFPNQYIILAGGPGSGKTTMVSLAKLMVKDLAADFPNGMFLGPDNPTKASFLQQLEKSTKLSLNGLALPMYSAMSMFVMELGVFISKYERDFIADVTHIYDNPPLYTAPRKVSASSTIEGPTLNILAAATPDALSDTIPEVAWSQGFTSRFIFVYGVQPQTYRDMFVRPVETDFGALRVQLRDIFDHVHGEFHWEPDAQDANRHWFNDEGQAPVPTYGRLAHYVSRRNEHIMKLAMVSAVSNGHGLIVTLEDFRRAQRWLFEAEETMPNVFRAMHQKSDRQILDDAHWWMYNLWSAAKVEDRKPIQERQIWKWFEDKVPSEKIPSYIDTMEKTGRMFKNAFGMGEWTPNTFDRFHDP